MSINEKKILLVDYSQQNGDFVKFFEKTLFDPLHFSLNSTTHIVEMSELLQRAIAINKPYALVFIHVPDVVNDETINFIKKILEISPDIQIGICVSGVEDYLNDRLNEIKSSDNILILKEPLKAIEVTQITKMLCKKWELKRQVISKIGNLENIIQEHTAELRREKDAAENANRLKSEFLENMSHEFRTPLNGIIGFAQLLQAKQMDPEKIAEFSGDILSSANRLLLMINDMLEMSQVDSQKIKPNLINIEDIVVNIINLNRKEIHDKKIKTKLDVDVKLPPIYSDAEKIKRIFYHFISNATKFSKLNGKIHIRVYPLSQTHFKIEVIDNGIGIKKEEIKLLFKPFCQLDGGEGKKYQGAGLGLALTRRIIESLGGKIGVKSQVDEGSCFFAELPINLTQTSDTSEILSKVSINSK